jgi:hypothetical protein
MYRPWTAAETSAAEVSHLKERLQGFSRKKTPTIAGFSL